MREELLVAVLITASIIILVTWVYPVTADFWSLNSGWNGLERLSSQYKAVFSPIRDISLLDPRNYTLFIIGPTTPFTEEDAIAVKTFLRRGGKVIIADDYGSANQLLEMLDLPVRIEPGVLVDPLLNIGIGQLPITYWGNKRVALNYAAALNTSRCSICRVFLWSSPFSYLDLNNNGAYDPGEPKGPLPIGVSLNVYGGEVVVIADSSVFLNSMLDRESNKELLNYLLGTTRPAVDDSHWQGDTLVRFKEFLESAYKFLSVPEIKYSIAITSPLLLVAFSRKIRKI
ncbi:MAG: DUF4350 domain-containing protein [Infirmifilum sp.]|uniref:DUF4350 domain-containing protein n=1 Tax=Infirmifilum sp. TaxID=2856575 RepID=UPI003D150F13